MRNIISKTIGVLLGITGIAVTTTVVYVISSFTWWSLFVIISGVVVAVWFFRFSFRMLE